jgi:hypothetical protein
VPWRGAGAEQALGGQHLDRLARHGAAGAELLGQLAFGRKDLAIEGADDDRLAQFVKQAMREVAAQDGRGRRSGIVHAETIVAIPAGCKRASRSTARIRIGG